MTEDNRNIVDRYKGWMIDLIRDDLKSKSFPYAVLMENWQGDFNIGTLVRNANAFNAKEVFYLGKKHWDRRGAVGTYNYTSVQHFADVELFLAKKEFYTFIGVDNVPGAISIKNFSWPKNSLMIFGEEGIGITTEMLKICDQVVEIPMHGSVRSLNAGSASAIVMYDYVNKYLG